MKRKDLILWGFLILGVGFVTGRAVLYWQSNDYDCTYINQLDTIVCKDK